MAKPSREQLRADLMTLGRFIRTQSDVTDRKVQDTCMDEWSRVVRGEIKIGTCIRHMKQIIAESKSPALP